MCICCKETAVVRRQGVKMEASRFLSNSADTMPSVSSPAGRFRRHTRPNNDLAPDVRRFRASVSASTGPACSAVRAAFYRRRGRRRRSFLSGHRRLTCSESSSSLLPLNWSAVICRRSAEGGDDDNNFRSSEATVTSCPTHRSRIGRLS